ncbi:MAG: lipopolysaccharide transport periplasmic protein LptA [Gammaproteobacteria bacterium]|nr:lipopolysaccharide transport periplasmic protein LptA [Gammaproteobacteria bacterium]
MSKASTNPRSIVQSVFLTALIACLAWSSAFSDDSGKPISIKADSAEMNENTGISIYRGNVRVAQGSMRLTGDTVVVESVDKKVHKIKSEGDLTTFRQTADDGKTVYAEAQYMVYDISKKQIILTKNAKLTEDGNTFASDSIVFHVDKKTVSGGSSEGSGRVNITVLPETVTDESPMEASP